MSADTPTILATSGGIRPGVRVWREFSGVTEFAIELSGVSGRALRVCCLPTAAGDSPFAIASFYDAALQRGIQGSHLTAFPMPNLDHVREHLDRHRASDLGRKLLALAHPDKWSAGQPATALAHEVAAAINTLRDRLGVA